MQESSGCYDAVMDIEKLTKSQIILLTLLVSFVTSIATGIVTVTLMEQAPPTVAQTLNRIVERTVEKVVAPDQTASAASSVKTEKTVIVKETELISQAVAHALPTVVRIYKGVPEAPEFAGLGVVVSKSGLIMTDLALLPGPSEPLYIDNGGEKLLAASVVSREQGNSLALLQSATSTSSGEVSWRPASISSGALALGQTVITVAGRNSARIDDGIVSALPSQSGAMRGIIDTNIPSDSIYAGGPLINTEGDLIGISTYASRSVARGGFIASSALLAHISSLSKK